MRPWRTKASISPSVQAGTNSAVMGFTADEETGCMDLGVSDKTEASITHVYQSCKDSFMYSTNIY